MPAGNTAPGTLRRMARSSQLVGIVWLCQTIGWGFTFDMPAVAGRLMAAELNLPIEVIFLGMSAMMLTSAVVSPFMGRLLAPWGAARVLATGCIGIAIGLIVLSMAHSAALYLLAWLLVGIGSAFALSVPAMTAIVEREEPGRARQTLGWFLILTALTTTVTWPVIATLSAQFGWRTTCLIGACAQLLVCLPCYLLLLPRPAGIPDAVAAQGNTAAPLSASRRRVIFALVALITSALFLLTLGLSPSIFELLKQAGADEGQVFQVNAMRGFAGIAARIAESGLTARLDPLSVGIAACLSLMLSFAVLLFSDGQIGLLFAFALLCGLGGGLGGLVRSILPLRVFHVSEFGIQSARLALPQNLVLAFAPVLYSSMLDRLGMHSLLVLCTSVAALAILALFWLRHLLKADHPSGA